MGLNSEYDKEKWGILAKKQGEVLTVERNQRKPQGSEGVVLAEQT